MIRHMQNKKAILGDEFILWFFRLFLLLVILAVIILIVHRFYSKQYDIREIEANLLASNFAECLIKKNAIAKSDIEDVFDSCKSKLDSQEYYVNISLSNKEVISNSFGKDTLKVLCETKLEQTYFPSCVTKDYLVTERTDEGKMMPARLRILVAILKTEKNV
jgi:pantothenate kinase